MKHQAPKGTEDYYPEKKQQMEAIFSVMRATAKKFNYQEIETPAFENLSLLAAKSGEEVKEQIFVLEKRKKEQFGLRFDITVPATRMFVQLQKALAKPVKWYYLTRMWRYERPQAGRQREFYQFGVELLGSNKIAADAEVITLAIATLKGLGLKQGDFYVKLNNRKLLEGLLLTIITEEKMDDALRIIDKRMKITKKEFIEELKTNGITGAQKIEKLLQLTKLKDIEKLKKNSLAAEGFEELKTCYSMLDKKFVRIDLSVARGLAYYTGTVFEIYDKDSKFRALCGGGRYDQLVELFGGESCPATGFGMGYSTIRLFLQDRNLLPEKEAGPDYFIAPIGEKMQARAMKLANELREKYTVDIDLMGRSLTKLFNYADSINAQNIVIVGEKDYKQKKVTIRNLASGKEKTVLLSKIKNL